MWQRKRTVVATLACLVLLAGTSTSRAQSCILSDWLGGLAAPRTTAYYRAPAWNRIDAAPTTTTYYRAPLWGLFAPRTTAYYRAPLWGLFAPRTTTYYRASSACSTCPTPARQIVRYVPQTYYRTAWARVPVTSYRPVTTTDPMTGCPVTCMKPCTTFSWQARRVPYTTYRPAPRGIACNPCGTATPTRGPYTGTSFESPYYSGGGSSVGGGGSSYGVPTPATVSPPAASSAGSPMPADRPPSLDPRQLPPSNVNPPAATQPIAPTPSAGNGGHGGHQQQRIEIPMPPAKSPTNSPTTRLPSSPTVTPGGRVGQPSANTKPLEGPELRPVPDPEATHVPRIPALLDPRDRTAARSMRTRVASPLRWAGSLPTRTAVYQKPAITPVTPVEEVWDDSGWKAVGR